MNTLVAIYVLICGNYQVISHNYIDSNNIGNCEPHIIEIDLESSLKVKDKIQFNSNQHNINFPELGISIDY